MNGFPQANTVSEWKLQSVLYKANLVQYYDAFVSEGGDDVEQFIKCNEEEFLELVSVVRVTKPLHIKRLRETLTEFSQNRLEFLLNSIVYIGPPPMDLSTLAGLTAPFLAPGFLPNQTDSSAVVTAGQSGLQAEHNVDNAAQNSVEVEQVSHSGSRISPLVLRRSTDGTLAVFTPSAFETQNQPEIQEIANVGMVTSSSSKS
ncbi:NAB conserved region 1 (NCD1) domain-containing protein [Ditylenchus destructor]|nr:NAB conserved region 1 (NCD1) domain-containing protein [Ditylenchus destructor]